MKYAVALTLTKQESGYMNVQSRLSFHHECDSKEQALGEAIMAANKELPEHSVQTHLVGEIGSYSKPDSTLEKILEALGWEGGTIHQALEEVRVLKTRVAQLEEALVNGKMREDRDQSLARAETVEAEVERHRGLVEDLRIELREATSQVIDGNDKLGEAEFEVKKRDRQLADQSELVKQLVKEAVILHSGFCDFVGRMAPLPDGKLEEFLEISNRWVNFIQPVHERLTKPKEAGYA